MSYDLDDLRDELAGSTAPHGDALSAAVSELLDERAPRLRLLWDYYHNPSIAAETTDPSARAYRLAQEQGLPPRLVGAVDGSIQRKEIVVENDIAWRVDTMVDYLFGKPIVVNSEAPDPARRALIERLLRLILAVNGGIGLLQQMALSGAVCGFVDLLVKLDPPATGDAMPCGAGALGSPAAGDDGSAASCDDSALAAVARRVRIELVEPARALPLLHAEDWRDVRAYAQVCTVTRPAPQPRRPTPLLERLLPALRRPQPSRVAVVELITPTRWRRFEDGRLVASGVNALGRVPLVHVQNLALASRYAGASDVEPLIPLQDELNTRLSDRASRITLQSFRMYLGKGIDGFNALPVAPGRMWMTDNEQADIVEFGGDAECPSELEHIREIREALDKTSGVTPIAAGAIKARIGRLTSAAALRVTMLALLAKTERKRTTYGEGIERVCETALAWLDRAGLFRNDPSERRVAIHWPSPIPVNERERLAVARAKLRVGVDPAVVLRELGYAPS